MQTIPRDTSMNAAGWVAVAAATTQLIGIVFFVVFVIVGEPFGHLNDVCNALAGILGAALAWQLGSLITVQRPALGWLALRLAGLSALMAAAGSALTLSHTTGWVLAALYTTFGYGLMGLWLLALVAWGGAMWPRGLVGLGLTTGGVMALGLLTLPGLVRGLDAMEALPWYVSFGLVGWVGTYLMFPAWWLWLGRVLLRR
jgi:hypothetical protein